MVGCIELSSSSARDLSSECAWVGSWVFSGWEVVGSVTASACAWQARLAAGAILLVLGVVSALGGVSVRDLRLGASVRMGVLCCLDVFFGLLGSSHGV